MKLNYTVKGTGKSIVLLHGWAKTASIESLTKLQEELSRKGFKVWNIELPGFGVSENAPDVWCTPDFAKLIADFIDNEVKVPYTLFGHSFGGSLTAYIAANLEPKPEKIILCSSAGLRYKTLKARLVLPVAKMGKKFLSENAKKKIYYHLIRERDYVDTKDKKEQFVRITNYDLTDIFRKIEIPTLIVWGRSDKITPLKMAYKIRSLIPKSKLKIVEGRHGIPITQPEEIANLITEFAK